MAMEQYYQEMGSSCPEVCVFLSRQRLVEKSVWKYLYDQSYAELTAAIRALD